MHSKSILNVQRRPSRQLAALLYAAHAVSIVLLWSLTLPVALKVAIAVLVVISLIHYLSQDAWLTAHHAVTAFTLTEARQCTATLHSGKSVTGEVLGGTFVAPYLTVILYQPEGKFFTRSIVIFPDSIDAEIFRKLRVWLRWKVH